MWLYIFTCLVILNVVKSAQVKEPVRDKSHNDAPKQADVIFADVIKNISRVNHVLQELINNYEQLQKIYKSQENVENEYSDSEIDEMFKSKKDKQVERMNKDDEKTTKNPNSVKLATQMFWSDHEEDDDNSIVDDTNEKDNTIKESVKKNDTGLKLLDLPTQKTTILKTIDVEESDDQSSDASVFQEKSKSLKQGPINTTKQKNLQNLGEAKSQAETSEESSDESSDASVFKEKVKKDIKRIGKKPEAKKIVQNFAKVKPQAKVVFIDTHKKLKELSKKQVNPKRVKSKPKVEPVQFVSMSTKPKTRYSKVSHDIHKTESHVTNEPNKTRKVKKITHSESFSPQKIWNDIINNKPIQLVSHNEFTMRRIKKQKINVTDHLKRSRNGKSDVELITKQKENENVSSSEDETNKEELNTNVLRQAYGDACMKLVVKKCHKGCKEALRQTCNEVKCKSDVKSTFKSYARTGCIKEFHGVKNDDLNNSKNGKNIEKFTTSPITNYRGKDSTFADMTREGFLSAACLPHTEDHKPVTLSNETRAYRAKPVDSLNILRDRFEKACKKISSNKCKQACSFAYTKTCETKKCTKRMKKKFKSSCKKKCKEVYDLNYSSESDDSDDSDDSDEDSESDSESDSD